MNTDTKQIHSLETKNLYQQITDQIIQALDKTTAWIMPWHGHRTGLPKNVTTGKDYSGINVLSLWSAACGKGYASNLWGTYKQWQR
jgi:antirestriction protein ArdC